MSLSKIVQYGFLAFVFLLPFQTVFLWREPLIQGEKWQYGTIGLYATDILFVVLLASVLVGAFLGRYVGFRIANMKSHVPIILFIFWVGLSIIWAHDTELAYSFFITLLLAGNVFLWARLLDRSMIRKTIFVLMFGAVLQSGIGITQFLSQQSWDSTLLGMSAHESWQAGSSVLKIDGERFLRAYGTFPHPNMLGGFLVAILVSSIAYQVLSMTQLKRNQRLALLVSSLIIFLGLILTFSRAAWMGWVIGMVVLGGIVFRQKEQEIWRQFWKVLTVFIIAGGIFSAVLSPQIFPRFEGAVIEREGSVSERVQSFYDAKTVMDRESLFFGTGAGNFTERLLSFEGNRPVWTLQPVHNVLVLILAEIGVVGLFLWFIFLGTILLSFKKYLISSEEEQRGVRIIFGIALLSLLPSLFLDHWLWSSHFGLFLFFLFLGLSQSKDENTAQ